MEQCPSIVVACLPFGHFKLPGKDAKTLLNEKGGASIGSTTKLHTHTRPQCSLFSFPCLPLFSRPLLHSLAEGSMSLGYNECVQSPLTCSLHSASYSWSRCELSASCSSLHVCHLLSGHSGLYNLEP